MQNLYGVYCYGVEYILTFILFTNVLKCSETITGFKNKTILKQFKNVLLEHPYNQCFELYI